MRSVQIRATATILAQKRNGQLDHAQHGATSDLCAVPAQVQLTVCLTPGGDDGDMDRSRRMTVGWPRPRHPGGGHPQIGTEEPTNAARHLKRDVTVHRPGPFQVSGIHAKHLRLDTSGVGDHSTGQHARSPRDPDQG